MFFFYSVIAKNVSVAGGQTRVTLTDAVHPYTVYKLTIRGVTTGQGVASTTVSTQTAEWCKQSFIYFIHISSIHSRYLNHLLIIISISLLAVTVFVGLFIILQNKTERLL